MNRELHQWFTPRWVCEAIVDRYFRDLNIGDTVLEPSCGDGRFLLALPAEVPAIGVEIDPHLATVAAAQTGRRIIVGDFRHVEINEPVTRILGNPPFEATIVHGFLRRAHEVLPDGGTCSLMLPAYLLQTSSRVLAMNEQWAIAQELMPRNIFPRLRLPLVFARFTKDRRRTLVGFFLYREAGDVAALPKGLRDCLTIAPKGSVWRAAVRAAFDQLGLKATTLDRLYEAVERPSENRYWREKVRQTLQVYPEFRRAGAGVWALSEA